MTNLVERRETNVSLDGALGRDLVNRTRGHFDGSHLHGGAADKLPDILIGMSREIFVKTVAHLDHGFVSSERISV
jgi:hypothetical protein